MIQDIITKELLENKSVAAFLYLIENGRELEANFQGKTLFISKDGSSKNYSIWIGKDEQAFESVEELFMNGITCEQKIYEIWNKVEVLTLF